MKKISNALTDIIQILIKVCRKENIPIVLMGGIATSFYARPRATYDIDGIIYVERDKLDKFLPAVGKKGFQYNRTNPVRLIQNLPFLTLFHKRDKLYVDLYIAENEFQKRIIERAKKIKLGSVRVDIVSLEDLILLKLLTGRERDVDDVRNIICENFRMLDCEYLKKWAKRLGVKTFLDDEIKSLGIKQSKRNSRK